MFEHISFSNTYILLERHSNRIIAHYAVGEVSTVELYSDLNEWNCTVHVIYRTGERYSWNSNNLFFPAFYLYGIPFCAARPEWVGMLGFKNWSDYLEESEKVRVYAHFGL